jgi:hypothetical protein
MKPRYIRIACALVAGGALAFGQAASAEPSYQLTLGTTTVVISAETQATLDSQGIIVRRVNPATFDPDAGVGTLPISGGDIDTGASELSIEVLHQGGLTLRGGGTRVALTSFVIGTLGPDSILTAVIKVNDTIVGRIRLFRVELTETPIVVPPEGTTSGKVRLSNVELRLSQVAADALNAAFGLTDVFDGGSLFGTAEVFARTRDNDG